MDLHGDITYCTWHRVPMASIHFSYIHLFSHNIWLTLNSQIYNNVEVSWCCSHIQTQFERGKRLTGKGPWNGFWPRWEIKSSRDKDNKMKTDSCLWGSFTPSITPHYWEEDKEGKGHVLKLGSKPHVWAFGRRVSCWTRHKRTFTEHSYLHPMIWLLVCYQ